MVVDQQFPIEQYNQEGLELIASSGRPVPGQSLTNSPDEPRPFESAPDFTDFREALDFVVTNLLESSVIEPIMINISKGTPITDIVMQVLYVGFREGQWNPDLMMMLIEPLTYVLMALSERANIEFTIYRGEEEDDDNEDNDYASDQLRNLADLSKRKNNNTQIVPKGAVPDDILEKLENGELPSSLLAKDTPEVLTQEEEEKPASLLAR